MNYVLVYELRIHFDRRDNGGFLFSSISCTLPNNFIIEMFMAQSAALKCIGLQAARQSVSK